ncbi:hypothetical protein B0H12DRAFT_1068293 [Mycena haematopus]|nr:hypothetical protein B0H12DRAFT_1068293 [Mycena haematopus]
MAPAPKPAKVKEMFKPYNESEVPDIMPLPAVGSVWFTKSGDIAVPRLNDYQRSWILDQALRDVDLPGMKPKAARTFYDQVKVDAFSAKAFKHVPQPQDAEDEARIAQLVATWIREHPSKKNKNKPVADDGDASDEEEDEGGRTGLLRGYKKAGWRRAIQKVISNKRTAEGAKRKGPRANTAEPVPVAPAAALSKLFGLTASSGRDKFRVDRHDEIEAYSMTVSGGNNGAKFRRAEAELWAKEDKESWDDAVEADEDVDWKDGFQHMVQSVHASGKFRPFVAIMLMAWLGEDGKVELEWAEAIPDGVCVRQPFEKQYAKVTQDSINAMYAWAEKPLQDYAAASGGGARTAVPTFPLSVEALDDLAPNAVAQTVTSFLIKSYQAAFGSEEIPWPAIATAPDNYYDSAKFDIRFDSNGLGGLKGGQWHTVGGKLAAAAGEGTLGFFRKLAELGADEQREEVEPAPEKEEAAREEAARVQREKDEVAREEREEAAREQAAREEAARVQREKDEVAREQAAREEAARVQREKDEEAREQAAREEAARVQREKDEEAAREEAAQVQREKDEAAREEREEAAREEAARVQREREEEAVRVQREEEGEKKKGGKKRKAEEQLVPGVVRGRPSRTRKTPQEAEKERKEQVSAAVRGAGKPRFSYEYVIVPKSPVKTKAKRGSKCYRNLGYRDLGYWDLGYWDSGYRDLSYRNLSG